MHCLTVIPTSYSTDMAGNPFLMGTFVRRTPLHIPRWKETTQPSKNNLNKTKTMISLNTQGFLFLTGQTKEPVDIQYPSLAYASLILWIARCCPDKARLVLETLSRTSTENATFWSEWFVIISLDSSKNTQIFWILARQTIQPLNFYPTISCLCGPFGLFSRVELSVFRESKLLKPNCCYNSSKKNLQSNILNRTYTRWFNVTFSSPSWRSLNHLKGSLNHPKRVTKNCWFPNSNPIVPLKIVPEPSSPDSIPGADSTDWSRCFFAHQQIETCSINPIASMYGIFTHIYNEHQPNVGKYTIHGWYGNVQGIRYTKLPDMAGFVTKTPSVHVI